MNQDRSEELWSRFLEGAALSPGEESELLEAIRAGPSAFLQDAELDGLLDGAVKTSRDGDEFARACMSRISTVLRSNGTTRSESHPTHRERARFRRKRSYAAWIWVLAASALAAISLAILSGRSTAPPEPDRQATQEKPEKLRPVEPPPVPAPSIEPPPVEAPPQEIPEPVVEKEPLPEPPPEPEEKPPPPPAEDPPEPPEEKDEPPPPTRPIPTGVRIVKVEGELEAGSEWKIGETLETGRAPARITLKDGSRIALAAGSSLALQGATPAALHLSRGELFCEIAPGQGDRLIVETEEGRIAVKGTEFGVARKSRKTAVAVRRGSVLVEGKSGSTLVGPGMGTTLRTSSGPTEPEAVDADKLFAWRTGLDPDSVAVFETDFEAGSLSPKDTGRIFERNEPGNRFCVQGEPNQAVKGGWRIILHPSDAVAYSPSLVVEFDYRLEPGSEGFKIQIYNKRAASNFKVFLKGARTGAWTRAVVRLSDLTGGGRMQEGDPFAYLSFTEETPSANPVRIDNLRLLRYRPERLPETSFK